MMHVSWTTLQEQIFAKLRRPYRSEANMNEVGHDAQTSGTMMCRQAAPPVDMQHGFISTGYGNTL
jgi:hypothetical protein